MATTVPRAAPRKARHICSRCEQPKTRHEMTSKGKDLPSVCQTCRNRERRAAQEEFDQRFGTRECRICGQIKPAHEMAVSGGQPDRLCRRCKNGWNNGQLSRERPDLVAPDAEPAQRLRDLLAEHRRAGIEFEQAFAEATSEVLASIRSSLDRDQWRTAFSETEGCWHEGWCRRRVALNPLAPLVPLVDAA
jgi:hypothetical protein